MRGEADGGGVDAGQLLDHDGGVAEVAAGAAIFLRYRCAQQADLAGLAPDLLGHDAGPLPVGQVGHDLAVNEATRLLAE